MELQPDLNNQLASLSALTLLAGSSDLQKPPEITYNVLSGTHSLYTLCLRKTWPVEFST